MDNTKVDLESDGFVILRGVYGDSFLRRIRKMTDEVIEFFNSDRFDPFEKYYLKHRTDQGVLYDLYQRFPEYQTMAKNELILDTLESVLGPNIFMYENSLVYKPPGKRNGVPFHQDFISRPNEPIKYVAWMALDKITKDNGCLYAIPGSHKNGFLKWHRVKGETHHDRIVPGQFDENDAVALEMEPGDVLVFNMLVVHGSKEVHTESPRRAYRVSYQNFDHIFTPRGTPIVMRGGLPSTTQALTFEMNRDHKSGLQKFINRVGRRLAQI